MFQDGLECSYDTAGLLSRFIESGDNLKLSVDELVLVLGLVDGYNKRLKKRNYEIYDIEGLKETTKQRGFEHFEDKDFIRECILYGYQHYRYDPGGDSYRFHTWCLLEHVSHVFIKKFDQ